MDAQLIHQIRRDLALHYETLTDPQLQLAAKTAIVEHGAVHIPRGNDHWGPLNHEVRLLDIQAFGETLTAAMRDWVKCVLRTEDALKQDRVA